MAAPELPPEENAFLREQMKAALPQFGSVNKLALALGMQGSSLGAFLNKGGGASKATAHKFAALMHRSYDEVLGRVPGGPVPLTAPQREPRYQGPPKFRPTAAAVRKARVFLREGGQNFSDEAIDIAVEDTFLTSEEDAARPGAVAEALRHTILGSAARMPLAPAPSSVPLGGTRRSRARGR